MQAVPEDIISFPSVHLKVNSIPEKGAADWSLINKEIEFVGTSENIFS